MPPSVEDTGLIWSAMLGYPHAFRKQATEEAPGAESRYLSSSPRANFRETRLHFVNCSTKSARLSRSAKALQRRAALLSDDCYLRKRGVGKIAHSPQFLHESSRI